MLSSHQTSFRSLLTSLPSTIRNGPTDSSIFRGHRPTTNYRNKLHRKKLRRKKTKNQTTCAIFIVLNITQQNKSPSSIEKGLLIGTIMNSRSVCCVHPSRDTGARNAGEAPLKSEAEINTNKQRFATFTSQQIGFLSTHSDSDETTTCRTGLKPFGYITQRESIPSGNLFQLVPIT